MHWTDTARREHARLSQRYASDLTDREWELLAPFLPPPRRPGRPRSADLREVANAILYLLSMGCQWRILPKDFPPVSTVQLPTPLPTAEFAESMSAWSGLICSGFRRTS
ncbi:Putative transposase of IS4/5 family [Fulvimarina manganoxydans]|uniref:Putative transposase of IS4/5 family n=1 Tax=Fulvimarina manganoxydans TaxID=937218 RepID=A0A1W2CV32_9HYPH|nr:Putative transposase of IS4/5 family [Fulvimarina manganoxydans]